jgi:hypothetical protein
MLQVPGIANALVSGAVTARLSPRAAIDAAAGGLRTRSGGH